MLQIPRHQPALCTERCVRSLLGLLIIDVDRRPIRTEVLDTRTGNHEENLGAGIRASQDLVFCPIRFVQVRPGLQPRRTVGIATPAAQHNTLHLTRMPVLRNEASGIDPNDARPPGAPAGESQRLRCNTINDRDPRHRARIDRINVVARIDPSLSHHCDGRLPITSSPRSSDISRAESNRLNARSRSRSSTTQLSSSMYSTRYTQPQPPSPGTASTWSV